MEGQLDTHVVGMLEQKLEKSRFVRVDSETVNNLIVKDAKVEVSLSKDQKESLQEVFKSQLPTLEKTEFTVTFEALGSTANPVLITQSEQMRRMREMAAMQPGMSFYGDLPEMYNLVLNADHALVKTVLSDEENSCNASLAPIVADLKGWVAREEDLRDMQKDKKDEEISAEEKADLENTTNTISSLTNQRNTLLAEYATGNKTIKQLIDLALLSNGMLKGEALSHFIKRSVDLID